MQTVTAAQMRELDRRAQEDYGIAGLILMENAGLRAADHIVLARKSLSGPEGIAVVCGPGNNGGDGFVVARHLYNHGCPVRVFLVGRENLLHAEALINYRIVQRLPIVCTHMCSLPSLEELSSAVRTSPVVVDALLGIGINKPVSGLFAEAIAVMNRSTGYVVALDVPSGLCASSGQIFGSCVRAALTLTFGVMKRGLLTDSGLRQSGEIRVVDIGLPRGLVDELSGLGEADERSG